MTVLNNTFMRTLLVLIILVTTLVLGAYSIISREMIRQETAIERDVESRARALREYFVLSKHLLFSLRNTMESNLELAEAGLLHFPEITELRDIPSKGIYGRDNRYYGEPKLRLVGSLSGAGRLEDTDIHHYAELNAALSLNSMLESVIDAQPDLKWAYYTSAKKFFFLAPSVGLDQFHFEEKHLAKAFWQQAIPHNNPTLELVVTDVYEDAGGKGMMISLSLPVMHAHTFRGVVSLDIGLDSLAKEIRGSNIAGYSALIDEKHQVILKDALMESSAIEQRPGNLMYLQIIMEQQVMLLHKVPQKVLLELSLRASAARLVVIVFALALIYMVFHQNQLMRKIERLADTDPLTKLMNRRAMTRIVDSMITYNSRYHQHMSFMLLDIDHFKKVNDEFGHAVGDKVLVEVSSILTFNVRASDQVSRHGGEEFLIVLPNSDIKESERLAERIRMAVLTNVFSSDKLKLSISIGCAELLQDEEYSDVLNRADEALYRAKNNGRNQTIIA
ncbi:sensor domain-containing diguanylate cyclase [Teredinibacter purpureus]|uniref:sensor domain-containing diguanylate cyclase n=1 Tax=Teredinibacter purpureus TaxID=2731756 RepID=UPI0005F87ABD|nr:sensor domain-containing diguanylate cyclase [Teredinibacter purpureus]